MPDTTGNSIIRALDNGLILRRSTPADADRLYDFNAQIHGETEPDERIGQWTWDLLSRPHPTFKSNDFLIVEEQATGKIVSSLNLISQTWSYAGVPFKVGRPELVGTLPEFRKQNLVKVQFDEIHRWSAVRGELAQAITGIPFFYRQFGYEMCVDLGASRTGFEPNLPKLNESRSEPYHLRPASLADVPFISEVYAKSAKRSLLYAVRDEATWQLEIAGRSEKNIHRLVWNIIVRSADDEAVGVLAHPWFLWGHSVAVEFYELNSGISWLDVTPTVVRWMWEVGGQLHSFEGKSRSAFMFALEGCHPVYEILRDNLPQVTEPYAWYLRVPDLPSFINQIGAALNDRLTNSLIPGYSGELKISFFNRGLLLSFASGKLASAQNWQPSSQNQADISFPNLTFLQLLFGHRTLDDLNTSFPDCRWEKEETRVVISSLFPKKSSQILAIA